MYRAAISFAVVSVYDSLVSLKLNVRSQLVAVVVSPMERRHDSGGMSPSMESSQMQTMLARNSRRLM